MSITFEVLVGKHKLADDPTGVSEHWALGIRCHDVTVWYEVEGASKESTNASNKIVIHGDSRKYTAGIVNCGKHCCKGTEQELKDWLHKWHVKWVDDHPIYALNGDNCQMHVQDFLQMCGVKLETQNTVVGTAAVGAGVAAVVAGVFAVAVGLMVRGSHR